MEYVLLPQRLVDNETLAGVMRCGASRLHAAVEKKHWN